METSLEHLAAQFLDQDRLAKDATKHAKELKDQLERAMQDGQEVSVRGTVYRWVVTVGKAPKYKEVLSWLCTVCTPDVIVLIEEGQDRFVGSRVTKSLKPAE